jgi:hypothetical protein
MPVEAGPRTAPLETKNPSPLLQSLQATMTSVAGAVERGELTRATALADLPAPSVPAIAAPYQRPYVPREYRAVLFEQFDPNIAGPKHADDLAVALRAVKRWAKAAKEGRRAMLALVGSQGNGKSTLLYGAVNALAAEHVRVFSRPWYRLADELRYGGPAPWDPDGPTLEPHDLRRRMYAAPVVAIDEVRATAGTAFDDTELAKFACHAWDEGLAVLLTTNISPLSEVMGAAAADRFTVITITAPSRRQVD